MDIREKLYITTVAQNDTQTAEKYGAGIEIAEFCTAYNMDTYFAETDKIVREKMKSADRFVFHAPFNELCFLCSRKGTQNRRKGTRSHREKNYHFQENSIRCRCKRRRLGLLERVLI